MWWLCDFARSELRNGMNQIFVGTIVSTRTNGQKRGGGGLPPEHNQIKCKEIMAFYTEYQL